MGIGIKTKGAFINFMRTILTCFLIFASCFNTSGQKVKKISKAGTDLGLHGTVTWLSDTKIRVEYDWSDDSQLLDWTPTFGTSVVRGNNIITIKNGDISIRSMIWKQLIKCSRVYAQDAMAINSSAAHLNFITNVTEWTGYTYNPPEIIGLLYASFGNSWLDNGDNPKLAAPNLVLGQKYSVDINISNTDITALSSADNKAYTHTLSSPPDSDRLVVVGGWGGDTQWGKLTIEGEVSDLSQAPDNVIDFESSGSLFAPVIEVSGSPAIEWIFADGSTSSSATPSKSYGSAGIRHNYLRVTPWSSLIGINLGYDASDGGYGSFAAVDNQKVLAIKNISLAKSSLQYLCASYNPVNELDLRGFTALKFLELFFCHNLATLSLDSHPQLERVCIEECNLDALNLSGCPGIKDIRGAKNRYTTINWGSVGSSFVHICVRSNPQFTQNLPDLTRFPVLRELLIWDDNQSGPFVCHNANTKEIDAYGNHYTSADVSGCTALSQFLLSGSHLTSLNLGTANNLINVQLKNCYLSETLVDYVLAEIDAASNYGGNLELDGNAPPSSAGLTSRDNLVKKGWTVTITEPGQAISVGEIVVTGEGGVSSIETENGTLQLMAEILPDYASDKRVTWSLTNGTGEGTISSDGIVTAVSDGTVIARATALDGSGVIGELVINISNQSAQEEDTILPVISGNEMKIYLADSYVSWKIQLFNLQGSKIFSTYVYSNTVVFNTQALSPGMYLIVLSGANRIKVGKAIIP